VHFGGTANRCTGGSDRVDRIRAEIITAEGPGGRGAKAPAVERLGKGIEDTLDHRPPRRNAEDPEQLLELKVGVLDDSFTDGINGGDNASILVAIRSGGLGTTARLRDGSGRGDGNLFDLGQEPAVGSESLRIAAQEHCRLHRVAKRRSPRIGRRKCEGQREGLLRPEPAISARGC
jgi:hypothetical protein